MLSAKVGCTVQHAVVFAVLLLGAINLRAQMAAPSGNATVYPINPDSAPRPVARAARAGGPIVVDGRLDETSWSLAEPVTDFVQQTPRTGHRAVHQTVVRVLYDADAIYVGAICYDSDVGKRMIAGLEHDFNSGTSDIFGVTFDTYLDRRNSFLFLVNPAGAVRDEQTFNDSRNVSAAWDGVVHVQTTVGDSAWYVEMMIPLTTLRFDGGRPEQQWGMNLLRRVRRVNENSYWAPLDRRDVLHKMSRAGTLVGLEGLRQGRNLTIKPYAVAAQSHGTQVPSGNTDRYDAGGDLKYGLTSGLTLDLTYRTEFSQVEVDQEQVNLTRFSLLFPERREFFIENSGAFGFGDVSERNVRLGASPSDFTLFQSRRIGLTDDNRPIPIEGGGRITGRVGRFDVGLLDMQTRSALGRPAENFAVARLRRNIFGRSDVGVILINRQPTSTGGDYNRSYGADANIRLLGNMIINSYLAGTSAPGRASDGSAGKLSIAWRDRLWNTSAFVKRVGGDFTPGVGFIRRRAMRHHFGTVGIHARPKLPHVQELNPYIDADYITDLGSVLETRQLTAGTQLILLDGSSMSVEANDSYERLRVPFPIASGVSIPAGAYPFRDASVAFQSTANRIFSGTIRLSGGEFYDGTRRSVTIGSTWQPRYDLYLDLSLQRNHIDLPAGSFAADVLGSHLRYTMSTRLLGSAFVQYNTETRQVITNVRLDWRHAPLSDVYLVYTGRQERGTGASLEQSVALKVTRLVGF